MRSTSFLVILTIFLTSGCGGSSDSKPIQGKMSSKIPGAKGTGVPNSAPGGGKGQKARSGKSKKGGRGGGGGGAAHPEVKAQPVP